MVAKNDATFGAISGFIFILYIYMYIKHIYIFNFKSGFTRLLHVFGFMRSDPHSDSSAWVCRSCPNQTVRTVGRKGNEC